MYKIIISIILANFLLSEINHIHNHDHNNEVGMAIGVVPGHEGEDNYLGLHLHYIKGLGEHNDFGIGISLETIFDVHQHNSISIITLYHFKNGLTIAYAPGILFSEHKDENEEHLEFEFTQHFEIYYEFELEKFHIGPQFDIGFEDTEVHYMLGLHLGINF